MQISVQSRFHSVMNSRSAICSHPNVVSAQSTCKLVCMIIYAHVELELVVVFNPFTTCTVVTPKS